MARLAVAAPAMRVSRDASRFGLVVLALLGLVLLAPHEPVRWGPLGWLDATTARATAALAHLAGLEVRADGYSIVHRAGFACEVYYRCTGLLPAAFLAGAIFASPTGLRRRWRGAAVGVVVVLFVNLLRLVGLVAVGIHWPAGFELLHTLVSNLILVVSVAGFWFLWARRALVLAKPCMRIRMVSARITASLALGAFAVGLACPAAAQVERSVPGEIIVKFRAGTGAGDAASRAAQAGADAEAALRPLIRELSDALGVPLAFRRLGAGGDVLLALDRERLEEQLVGVLRRTEGVMRVDALREGSSPNPCRGIQITFARPGPDSEEVDRAVRRMREGKPMGTLEATRRLEQRTGLRLLNRLSASGELVVEPDVQALTDQTVRGLSARPDVEYAQPNYRVRALRP